MRPQWIRKNTLESSGQRATDPESGRRFELVLGGGGTPPERRLERDLPQTAPGRLQVHRFVVPSALPG